MKKQSRYDRVCCLNVLCCAKKCAKTTCWPSLLWWKHQYNSLPNHACKLVILGQIPGIASRGQFHAQNGHAKRIHLNHVEPMLMVLRTQHSQEHENTIAAMRVSPCFCAQLFHPSRFFHSCFFSILSGFTNFRPYFWPHVTWSGCRLNFCQSSLSDSHCKIVLSDDWMTPAVRTFQMRLEPKHTHTSSHQCHTDKNRYYSTECTGTSTGNIEWEQEKQQVVRGYADTPPRTRRPWWTWGRLLLQPSCWTLGPDYLQTLCWRVRSHSVDHTSILSWHTSSRPGQSDTWFPHALLLHLAEVSAVSVQFCILPIRRE